jgi:hypothetical protein
MSAQLHDDDVVARLRADAPGYPDAGPHAGRTLAAARRSLRRRRGRWALGSVAALVAAVLGLTAAGPIRVPGLGTIVMPGGHTDALPDQGDPPVYTRQRMLDDVAALQRQVLPVVEDLGLTSYIDDGPACRVFTWSRGTSRDRACANADNPELPFDSHSATAFKRVSDAITASGVNVYRIEQGGWGPGTAFRLRDSSIMWNWYYSYEPGTPADAPAQVRTQQRLGTQLKVHVTGDWWFTVEPDD